MRFIPSPTLPEVIIIEPDVFGDNRGFFMEMYHQQKFEQGGIKKTFVQDNRSLSKKGTLRGLHYQIARPQGKLVWALKGEVFDVVVDIRRNSPTYGRWISAILTEENKIGLYVPPDYAHGFYVLSEEAEFYYKCTDFYSPEHERCIRWDDPDLAIDWPSEESVLSEKDRQAPFFKDAEVPEE